MAAVNLAHGRIGLAVICGVGTFMCAASATIIRESDEFDAND
jgi:hypothetical protein